MNNKLERLLYATKARCKGNIIISDASINGSEEIYHFTAENIAGYIDFFDLKDKSLLTVVSFGNQITMLHKKCKKCHFIRY